MNLRIGTSGWSYPSGDGTWNGVFYPATRSTRTGTHRFDELGFYAEHFDTVEVNSTFYGQPRPDVTRTWVQRTPAAFDFSLKLYQKFTHPKMFREAALKTAPGSEGDVSTVGENSSVNWKTMLSPLTTPSTSSREL